MKKCILFLMIVSKISFSGGEISFQKQKEKVEQERIEKLKIQKDNEADKGKELNNLSKEDTGNIQSQSNRLFYDDKSVKNYPNSYQYASFEMQKDEDVVTEVLKGNEDALSYGDENIKQEIEEIKEKYKDSDFDGLTDREEKFIYGTNPYSKDTDLDRKSDYEEIKINYTNPKIKSKDIEIER